MHANIHTYIKCVHTVTSPFQTIKDLKVVVAAGCHKILGDLGVYAELKAVTSVPMRKQRDQSMGMQVIDCSQNNLAVGKFVENTASLAEVKILTLLS